MSQNISSNVPVYPQQTQYMQPVSNPNFTAAGSPVSSGATVVERNPLLNAAASTPENPLAFLGAAAASTLALFGINNFINKPLQTKDYTNTFFGRIENAIDSKTANNETIRKISGFLSTVKQRAKNVVDKSEILRTLFRKPSIGGPTVQQQAAGARGHLAGRALEIMRKYKEATGFTGFDAILQKAGKESYKHYDEIMNTIRNSGADLTKVMSKRPWWGLGLVKNKSSLKEILNKDILISNYKNAGTSLGKKVSGYLLRSAECLTNGIFSGKGQVLIQALMIAQAANEASKAEKGEKFPMFMASLAELMSFLATMGIQMRVVNNLAGLKHIGMSQADYRRYQSAMEAVNNAAKAGDAAAYNAQKAIIKQIKNTAKANTKWYQKPVKWLGNIFSFGRIKETIKPLDTKTAGSFLKKIPYGLKVGAGYIGRVALIMGVIVPIFSGIAKKLSYAVFGKPAKTLAREKAKEEAENAQAEQQQPPINQPQNQTPTAPQQTVIPPQYTQQPSKPGNLLDTMNRQYNSPASQSLYQPSAATGIMQQTPEQNAGITRSYIPNAYLGVENPINPASSRAAQIDAVLRQADIAEARARQLGA